MKSNQQLAGNILDELLGLDPGAPGTPRRVFVLVSERIDDMERNGECVGTACVEVTFSKLGEGKTQELVTIEYNGDDLALKEVKKDCAALARLGFDVLQEHAS